MSHEIQPDDSGWRTLVGTIQRRTGADQDRAQELAGEVLAVAAQSLEETGAIVMARPNPENPAATDLKILQIKVEEKSA